jgi:hypothetical protein
MLLLTTRSHESLTLSSSGEGRRRSGGEGSIRFAGEGAVKIPRFSHGEPTYAPTRKQITRNPLTPPHPTSPNPTIAGNYTFHEPSALNSHHLTAAQSPASFPVYGQPLSDNTTYGSTGYKSTN